MNSQVNSSIHARLAELLLFDSIGESASDLLPRLKTYLEQLDDYQKQDFTAGINVRSLVRNRAKYLDKMLVALWQSLGLKSINLSLIAVGGYGRGELHPHSDIDLLILTSDSLQTEQTQAIESFISLLWDCQLKVGHAVRTVDQCAQLAQEDISVATNLMEARRLSGEQSLFDALVTVTTPSKMWPAEAFFKAKLKEKVERYERFDGSSFDLEPNIKSSPGGLRDIHLIGWVAQRAYYPKKLESLIKEKVITKKEYFTLTKCQLFLWKTRFALHLVSGKAEDRLLFDHQKKTAKLMGFKNTKHSLAVEKLMKRYYRSAHIIRNLCDILLQVLEVEICGQTPASKTEVIDEHFKLVDGRIETNDPKLFVKKPSQLIQIFHHVAANPSIRGIRANTLRAIRAARYKITPAFRKKKNNKKLFVEFWHKLHTSPRAIYLMKRSGVLADYLPAFRQISGQMQYDMFHNYTVDEHTLFLLKNLCDFSDPEQSDAFPLCSEIMQRQAQPEIIYLAGLFHDIGKGRGGDHSEIGSIEAKEFCLQHLFDEEPSTTVSWLVGNHLLMSLVAQKRDISDPKVIAQFAHLVQTQQRLDLLYILTVADIRATSQSLWNSWKDSLLKNLYLSTKAFLKQETESLAQVWQENQDDARQQLINEGFSKDTIETFWQQLDQTYFSKRSPQTIAWHTASVLKNPDAEVVVDTRSTPEKSGTEVFVYTKDKENLFAALTATLSQQNLSIQAANIYTDNSGHCLDSFFVLDETGHAIGSGYQEQRIKSTIINNVKHIETIDFAVRRRVPRQFKYFSIETQVEFFSDEFTGHTRMELTARDHPGLLAAVGEAFINCKVRLHDARITTLGEKVEDIFIISHKDNSPILEQSEQESIRQTIIKHLNNRNE